MRTFAQIRESASVVHKTAVKGVPVVISKTPKGYLATVDGDKLDVFKSKEEALKTATLIIKDLKK